MAVEKLTGSARDDVTLRIDTKLRATARDLEINLSRMLEDALRAEVDRREAIGKTLEEGTEEIRLDLEDQDGRGYVGRFTGKLLGEARGVSVFLTDDERVIVYDENYENRRHYEEVEDLSELADWFPHDPGVYTEIMHALGETPEVDL